MIEALEEVREFRTGYTAPITFAAGRRIGADPGIMIRGRQIGGISQVRRGGDVLVAFLQILQQRWVRLEFVIAGAELMAAAAISELRLRPIINSAMVEPAMLWEEVDSFIFWFRLK